MSEKKRLIIIDSNSLIHRAYHALPPLATKKGELVNAIYGFLLVFFKAIREFQPDYIAACFDTPQPTFRHRTFKEYKAKRPPTPEDLSSQISKLKEVLKVFSIQTFEKEGFEADDIIGTIAKIAPQKQILPEIETIILSGDFDILQLINSQTKVYILRKGVKDIILYDETEFKKKYGLFPQQLLDFKALVGDYSDNIPGVPGIGEKTAIQLIKEFGSLENLYSALNQRPLPKVVLISVNQRLRAKLEEYKEQAFLSKNLVQIKKDIPVAFNLKECQWGKYDKGKVVKIFQNFDFNSLIKRLSELKPKDVRKNLKLW